jgi:hypothetical protein
VRNLKEEISKLTRNFKLPGEIHNPPKPTGKTWEIQIASIDFSSLKECVSPRWLLSKI